MQSENQPVKPAPDWRKLNFHEVMVLICDTFDMTHPQMMSLRQKLERVYGTQNQISIKALAILAYRRFAEHEKGKALAWVLQAGSGKLLKSARKIDSELYVEQK